MEVSEQITLLVALLAIGFWRPMGWVLVICGLGVVSISLGLMDTDEPYTIPYLFLGFGQFILGIFRARITGK